jgi:hypothetical protein
MLFQFEKLAIRVFAVFAPQAICGTAMLNHAIMADRPVVDIARAFLKMPRDMRIFPYHLAAADFADFCKIFPFI